MTDRIVVIFETADVEVEERLIREYVVSALPRLEERDEVKWVVFNRYGHDPSVDGGEVLFSIFGDVQPVVEDEREHWNELVSDGLADDWWTHTPDMQLEDIDERDYLHFRMRATASRMSIAFFKEFDELPDAISEFDDVPKETHTGVGWWMCLHHLINQLGYQANGGEEEINLVFEVLQNRLFSLSSCFGADRAEAKIADLIETLEARSADVRRFREEHGQHQHAYANREAFEGE